MFNNSFSQDNVFEVLWSGEASVVGHQVNMPSLWGWIKGPGPNDVIAFPQGKTQWIIENSVVPDVAPPTITMVSDNGGVTPIEAQSLTRTEEVLTLMGNELASVTAIEIMHGNLVLQTIMPAKQYVISNQRIDIPAGIITDAAEGATRTVRAWNSVGVSEPGPQKFGVITGRPFIGGTDADNAILDRRQAIAIQGYGFKSKTAGETQLAYFRIDESTGAAVDDNGTAGGGASNGLPRAAAFEVISDKLAVLPINSVNPNADGSNRRLRVARKTVANAADLSNVLSPGTNPMFTSITTKPFISTVWQMKTDNSWEDALLTGMFKRDRAVEINGTALNTATVIEVVQENGSSFANPVFIQLPNAGVSVEDNGTRILMSAGVIPYSDADTNTTAKRSFKIYNAVGDTDLNASLALTVNTQPVLTAISLVDSTGQPSLGYLSDNSTALVYVRGQAAGGPITVIGTGFKAVGEIRIAKIDGSEINATDPVYIPIPSPGVTVTDTQIVIDSSIAQFANGASADSNKTSDWRRFQLLSAREAALRSQTQRFYVGPPPVYNNLAGLTPGSLHYRRDSDVMTFMGENLSMMTRVEIVDRDGNSIPGAPSLLPSNLNIIDDTSFSISPNTFQNPWFLDSVVMDRRLKVITPFGFTLSNLDANGSFTVTATPKFDGFTGGGYDPGTGTFDASKGPIIIRGDNFRGMSKLEFGDAGSGVHLSIEFNPKNPPEGIVINERGTEIHIDHKFFAKRDETWLRSGGSAARTIAFSTPTKQKRQSPAIKTRDRVSRTLLNGTHPPTITLHPVSASVTEGNSTTLTSSFTNAVGYQWHKNNHPIPGATTSSYTSANFQAGHQGNYRIVASNAGGRTMSAEATLTLIASGGGGGGGLTAPAITTQPLASQTIVTGNNA
ncbi:MAG: immunoglobulin domain-containing protein, partial [Verrucomicrobiota bacterium]|nr:immunoglobulin domain-containing protein [Verrucomicrobiota bacterium]